MLKVVTLLSTLRDPTQVKRRQCATRKHPKEFVSFFHSKSHMPLAAQKIPIWNLALGTWQLPYAHQKDQTKKVTLAAKKSSARD